MYRTLGYQLPVTGVQWSRQFGVVGGASFKPLDVGNLGCQLPVPGVQWSRQFEVVGGASLKPLDVGTLGCQLPVTSVQRSRFIAENPALSVPGCQWPGLLPQESWREPTWLLETGFRQLSSVLFNEEPLESDLR